MTCVNELMDFVAELPHIPTLINYMGYVKDCGIILLESVIPVVSPTMLVEIRSEKKKYKNFAENEVTSLLKNNNLIDIHYVNMKSMADDTFNELPLRPGLIREICVLAYIGRAMGSDLSVTSSKVATVK